MIWDKIVQKFNGWKEKSLSLAGKETLLKSVVESIMTYVMSFFLLP